MRFTRSIQMDERLSPLGLFPNRTQPWRVPHPTMWDAARQVAPRFANTTGPTRLRELPKTVGRTVHRLFAQFVSYLYGAMPTFSKRLGPIEDFWMPKRESISSSDGIENELFCALEAPK